MFFEVLLWCVFFFKKIIFKYFFFYKLLRIIIVLLFYDEVSGFSMCVVSCGWDWSGKFLLKYILL